MSKKIKVTGKPAKRIKVTGKAQRKIDPKQVADALGAELVGKTNSKDLPLPRPVSAAPALSGIAQKMSQLIEKYNGTYKGYALHLQPECAEDWSPNYAIADGYYFEWGLCSCDDDDYHSFDADRLQTDFEKDVMAFFGPDAVGFRETHKNKEYDNLPFGTLVVVFHRQSQEIEVYRKGFITINDEEFLERKDDILGVLNAVLDPESWWQGNCGKGWARKMSIVHWVQRIFK